MIQPYLTTKISTKNKELQPFFAISLTPMFDVTSAIVFTFIMVLSINWLKTNRKGETTYNLFAILMIHNMPYDIHVIGSFILSLGIAIIIDIIYHKYIKK